MKSARKTAVQLAGLLLLGLGVAAASWFLGRQAPSFSDVPMHAAQVEAIKAHGALAAIELAHGGMRARNYTSGLPVPGPSALPVKPG